MMTIANYHKALGWTLALAWLAAGAFLLVSLPEIETIGEHGLFPAFVQSSPFVRRKALDEEVQDKGSRLRITSSC